MSSLSVITGDTRGEPVRRPATLGHEVAERNETLVEELAALARDKALMRSGALAAVPRGLRGSD